MTKQEFKQILESFPAESVSVRVENGWLGKFLAEIISKSFEGMDDVDRQQKVWEYLLGKVSDEDVEFVFTYTPDETHETPSWFL